MQHIPTNQNQTQSAKEILVEGLYKGLLNRLNLHEHTFSSHIEFMKRNVFIRDMHSKIVPLVPRSLQEIHYKNKLKAKEEGKHPHFLLLKYRRGGFTTFEQAQSYTDICTRTNVDCVTLAQDKDSTQNIFRMVKLMHQLNPSAPPIGYDSKVEISYPSLNNSFHISTARAKAFGRGSTLHRVHGSEVAHWDMSHYDIDDLTAGLTEAARFGEVVYETTAKGAQGWFYQKFKEAMEDNTSSWTPLFYPWFIDPMNSQIISPEYADEILETLDDDEVDLVDRNNLNIEQLAWRRQTKKKLKRLFPQEYPSNWNEAFLIRGSSFFDNETLSTISSQVSPPLQENGSLTIWSSPEKGKRYICGADCSEGLDRGDYSTACILCYETGEQVARLMGKWRPEVFARKAIDLCQRYNNAVFACEINNHGHSVMNTVVNSLKYRYIYYRMDTFKRSSSGSRLREKRPGWHTNAQTRPLLLDDLNEAIEEGYMIINDTIFIEQCKTFIDRGGRYEASEGEHDDLVMGWGIAWQARKVPRKGTVII